MTSAYDAPATSGRDPEVELEKLQGPKFLNGLKVLDVGCGGGLFAEVRSRQRTVLLHIAEDDRSLAPC